MNTLKLGRFAYFENSFVPRNAPKPLKADHNCNTLPFCITFLYRYLYSKLPYVDVYLTLKDPIISESCIEIKIKLNFYFHTSLWCLKRIYEGLHKTF